MQPPMLLLGQSIASLFDFDCAINSELPFLLSTSVFALAFPLLILSAFVASPKTTRYCCTKMLN